MAEEGRESGKWRLERQGPRLLQPSQPRQTGLKAAAARRGVAPRLLLCADEGDEEEVNFDQDCKRSK